MKLVEKEPKFKPTDGKVVKFDDWLSPAEREVEDFVRLPKGNWCKSCNKSIPLDVKYCPHCGVKQ